MYYEIQATKYTSIGTSGDIQAKTDLCNKSQVTLDACMLGKVCNET